jgi:NADPH2:quinone reductase
LGLAAIQIGKALGLTVIATANSPEKRSKCKDYGADLVLNSESDWKDAVRSFTPNKGGVDIVLDVLGMVEQSLKCIAWNGRIVVIGFAAGKIELIAMNRILLKNCSLTGLFWGQYATFEPHTVDKVWKELFALIEQKKIRPMIYTGRQFNGLESVSDALKLLAKGDAWGKIGVSMPQEWSHKI